MRPSIFNRKSAIPVNPYGLRRKIFLHPHLSKCFIRQIQPVLVVEPFLCHPGPPLRTARQPPARDRLRAGSSGRPAGRELRDLRPWTSTTGRWSSPSRWRSQHALQVASAEELPFADGIFRRGHHQARRGAPAAPGKAIAEIGRVTAPGGILILATPNLDSLLKPWKGRALDRLPGPDPYRPQAAGRVAGVHPRRPASRSGASSPTASGTCPTSPWCPKCCRNSSSALRADSRPSPGWSSCQCAGGRVSW